MCPLVLGSLSVNVKGVHQAQVPQVGSHADGLKSKLLYVNRNAFEQWPVVCRQLQFNEGLLLVVMAHGVTGQRPTPGVFYDTLMDAPS